MSSRAALQRRAKSPPSSPSRFAHSQGHVHQSGHDHSTLTPVSSSEMAEKLMSKITEQANELLALSNSLESSERRSAVLEDKVSKLLLRMKTTSAKGSDESGVAVQSKSEESNKTIEALEKRLHGNDNRLKECMKHKQRLQLESDGKTKILKENETKINEILLENAKIKELFMDFRNVFKQFIFDGVSNKGVFSAKTLKGQIDSFVGEMKDENDSMKKRLAEISSENIVIKQKNVEISAKLSTYEETLQIKLSDSNIGSHGDLLGKLAAAKGENAANMQEIRNKNQAVMDLSNTNKEINLLNENLHKQISYLKVQKDKLHDEIERLQSTEIGTFLKSAEQERDALLEFIKVDMKKNNAAVGQLTNYQNELELAHKKIVQYENKINVLDINSNNLEESYNKECNKVDNLTIELSQIKTNYSELSRSHEILKHDTSNVTGIIERKNKEMDELSKMQVNILQQMNIKDDKIEEIMQQLESLSRSHNTISGTNSKLAQDNNDLNELNASYAKEIATLTNNLKQMEPLYMQMEPEILKLRNDKNELVSEINRLQNEILSLRPLKVQLDELNSDLEHALKIADSNSHHATSLTSSHAMWTNLPALRHLSPILYERIRKIASDLHYKEVECKDGEMRSLSLRKQFESNDISYNEELGRMVLSLENNNRVMDDLKSRLSASEDEVLRYRSARTTIEQLRIVLLSYPGGLQALIGSMANPSSSSNSNNNNNNNVTFDSILHQSPSSWGTSQHNLPSTPSSMIFKQMVGKSVPSISNNTYTEEDLRHVPDHLLPDLVGRALLYNSNAVTNLSESTYQVRKLNEEMESLKSELSLAKKDNETLRYSINDLQRHITSTKSQSIDVEDTLRSDLETATELVEKQNALAISLESKLESCKRERQIKVAQVTSLLQREESIRFRLYSLLHEHGRLASIDRSLLPPEGAKLNDLVQYTNDILVKLTYSDNCRAINRSVSRQQQQQRVHTTAPSNSSTRHSDYNETGIDDEQQIPVIEPSIVISNANNTYNDLYDRFSNESFINPSMNFNENGVNINDSPSTKVPKLQSTKLSSSQVANRNVKFSPSKSGTLRSGSAMSQNHISRSASTQYAKMGGVVSPGSKVRNNLQEARYNISSLRENY